MADRKADLQALVSLIQNATNEAIQTYEDSGVEIPSLDSPSAPPSNLIALRKAVRVLEGACFQLCATLAPPEATMFSRGVQCLDLACIRIAVSAKIPNILEGHPEGLHVSEIAKKTGIDEGKLAKILRSLATQHCFRETAAETFANNRLSVTMMEENPFSALMQWVSTYLNKIAAANVYDAFVDPEYKSSYEPKRTVFGYGVKDTLPNASIYEWLTAYREESKLFNRAMTGLTLLTDGHVIVDHFPWKDLAPGSTVCDLGGGVGTVSIELAKRYHQLHVTVQDLPDVIVQARQFWETNYPTAALEKRADFVPLDFLNESPVKGQDIYYLRQIIHNWPADCGVTILKNIAKVMKPESRILVHDYVLQPNFSGSAARDLAAGSGVNVAPKPLLPNYGYGSARAYTEDVSMLVLTNAGERTLDEFLAIGNAAGLKFVKLWDFAETALIEFAAA
ncbi:S-adenosyl-L-methionine-dependent methyltransferase [Dentipellis sp. KUC8613]|nr:S-adenosyl-L-methionine-dependent methyltransferase [Dentipellis sp. KUC8613]